MYISGRNMTNYNFGNVKNGYINYKKNNILFGNKKIFCNFVKILKIVFYEVH